MAGVVAAHPGTGLVVMHNQHGTEYGDLLEDVCLGLRKSVAAAEDAGIPVEHVIIDPGFGFAKTPAHNLELIRRLGELLGLGRAVLVGPSRKSTIGLLTDGADQSRRLEGSLAFATLAVQAGAHMVRVHDVAPTLRALRVADAVVRGTPESLRSAPIPGSDRMSSDGVSTDTAWVSLGSNVGHRGRNLARLREALTAGGVSIIAASPEILTLPVGVTAQGDFHNQVVRLRSPASVDTPALARALRRRGASRRPPPHVSLGPTRRRRGHPPARRATAISRCTNRI